MASSSYYYDLYKKKKKEAEDYDDDLKELNKILSSLVNSLYDEIKAVNDSFEKLNMELKKAVRHNVTFTSEANKIKEKKEKPVDSDKNLSNAKNALEDEIAKINGLKTQAISDRDYYYNRYLAKREEEREEARRAAQEAAEKAKKAAEALLKSKFLKGGL